jgi:hypothetical protein
MGTKIFDYIGVRRKMIMCYGTDEKAESLKEKYYSIEEKEGFSNKLQEELIVKTNSGIIVTNEEHLREVLVDLIEEFKQKGMIDCNSVGVDNYSRRIQAKKLAEIIKQ